MTIVEQEVAPGATKGIAHMTLTTTMKRIDDKGTKGLIITAETLLDMHKFVSSLYREGINPDQIKGFSNLVDYLDDAYRKQFLKEST